MMERGSWVLGGDEEADEADGEGWDILVRRVVFVVVWDVGALGSYVQNDSRFLERQFAQGSSRSHWVWLVC